MDKVLTNLLAELINEKQPNYADNEIISELEILGARSLIKQGQLEQASQLLESAIQKANNAVQRAMIAEQLLILAKAFNKRPDIADAVNKAEAALRQAADIAPALAAPALAQHLQRQKRAEEAINQWQTAIKANPLEANNYLSLARLYEQTGQPDKALATYQELIQATPSHKTYLITAQRLDELEPSLGEVPTTKQIKIALLGNATLDHLQAYLKVECYRAGLRPQFYQGGFDQYTQQILDPQSGLYAFQPDILVCAIHPSRLFPQLQQNPFDLTSEQRQAELENGLKTIQNLIDTFAKRSSAMVLFHNMVLPQYPALGIYDWREENGQLSIFNEINRRLAEIVRTRSNIYLLDEEKVQARCGKARATDPRLWFTARMGWSEAVLPELAKEYMRFIKPFKALSRKCIVVDLDNTLWGGVIGEDGLGGIQIGSDAPGNAFAAFQRELLKLNQRGILLAISSKNNPEDALLVFEQHPGMVLKIANFAAQRINWQPKEINIREIAKELNIGLDSLVFLDDNPVERAKVRAELPQVLVPELPTDPAYYRRTLLELDVFDTLALTEEDRNRQKLYATQQARQEFEENFSNSSSLDDYLVNLEMVVEIDFCNSVNLPRIAQLTNKTNQFNLTTHRRSEAQITELQAKGWQVYSLRVTDKFGDNGLTGVAIIEPKADSWEVDTLLLSCRVMGRGVETALLAFIAEQAQQSGIKTLQGWFLPTAKNEPAKDCYSRHNFSLTEENADGRQLWSFNLAENEIALPEWLTVRTPQRLSQI